MPRYHFEIANGHRLHGPGGLECQSDQDAREKADIIARRIAAEVDTGNGRTLVVVNETGTEIYKVPVK